MRHYRVLIEPEAAEDLQQIYDFICENDTDTKAKRFLKKLQQAIDSLATLPDRCRKSIYVDREGCRDLIVQGYTITYFVNEESVHILAVFRQRAT